jgi:DNA recombination protein RmuC
LQKSVESEGAEDKKRFFAQFQQDVRKKIKDIATRDYINPDEQTVDFAVAFIPNEMIFSFIYERSNDIWEEAMNKKVVLAGPYSFVALLRMIKQAHSNFHLQTNLHSIIQLVQKFRQEYEKFTLEFNKIDTQLNTVRRTYDEVASTRSRKLDRVIDQIESQQVLEKDSGQPDLLN